VSRVLLLDTSILIELERGVDPGALGIGDQDDLAIATITYGELWTATELAGSPEEGEIRRRRLDAAIGMARLLDYTRSTAMHHARLLAATRRSGRPRGPHDLIIAAHALESGRALVSRDAAARFGDLPGVQVV